MRRLQILLLIFFTGFSISTLAQRGERITATFEEVLSKKKVGWIDTYITNNGEQFSIGDTITLGTAFRNENFDYIMQNAGIEYYSLSNIASNSKVIIKKIIARSKIVIVNTTRPQGFVYGLIITNFESAIINGEIVSNLITEDMALKELKKWKDKLDLGLISEEEYEKKKAELSKYIVK